MFDLCTCDSILITFSLYNPLLLKFLPTFLMNCCFYFYDINDYVKYADINVC
jgi:hypothetical protein